MNGTVNRITRKNGDVRWRVTVSNGRGGSTRKEFRTENQAAEWHKAWLKNRRNKSKFFASVRESDQAAMFAAWERARAAGFDLMDAVTHYERFRRDMVAEQRSLRDAVEDYVSDCIKRGLKDRSVSAIRLTVEPFAESFSSTSVDEVTEAHIGQWIDRHSWSPQTVNNALLRLGGFFRWAQERGWTNSIPIRKSHRRKVERDTPPIFSPDQVRRLMNVAFSRDKGIACLLAVQFFAGLRPAEAADPERSGLDKVDLETRELWVKGKVERQRRIVKISDNLKAWIEACGEWAQTNVRRRLEAVRKAAEIEWAHDVTRHSFASYHLAAYHNAAKTAHEMGHSGNSQMLWQHYRAVVRKAEADQFWSIAPDVK